MVKFSILVTERWARSWSRYTGSQPPQVTFYVIPVVGCHYFPPGLRSPSQPNNVTVLRPVPSYTAWYLHRCEQLAQGCYAALSRWKLNLRPIDRKSNELPLHHFAAPYTYTYSLFGRIRAYSNVYNILHFTTRVCWSIDIKSVIVRFVARVVTASCDECSQSLVAVNVYRKSWSRRKTGTCWRDLVCQTASQRVKKMMVHTPSAVTLTYVTRHHRCSDFATLIFTCLLLL